MQSRGFDVAVRDSLDVFTDTATMQRFQLVVPIWTMGQITREQREGLCNAVRNGCGLAGWHGGMCDAFRNDTEYQFMTGGQWVAHPGGILPFTVRDLDPRNPLTRGLKPFRMRSEQYYLHTDPGNQVLAWTTFSGKHGDAPWIRGTRMPVVWTRRYGRGRVFYCSLGHVDADFETPQVFELVKRGIQWAARLPVRAEFNG